MPWHILSVHRLVMKSCQHICLEPNYMRTSDITNVSTVLNIGCSSGHCILSTLFVFSPPYFQVVTFDGDYQNYLSPTNICRVQTAGYNTSCVLNTDLYKFKITHVYQMPCPSHSPWCNHPNSIWQDRVTELLDARIETSEQILLWKPKIFIPHIWNIKISSTLSEMKL